VVEDCQGELYKTLKALEHEEVQGRRNVLNAQVVGEEGQEPAGREILRVDALGVQEVRELGQVGLSEGVELETEDL